MKQFSNFCNDFGVDFILLLKYLQDGHLLFVMRGVSFFGNRSSGGGVGGGEGGGDGGGVGGSGSGVGSIGGLLGFCLGAALLRGII